MHPVTLRSLNGPLKHELAIEMQRVQALAHNTLVQHGYLNANLVRIPDVELEEHLPMMASFNIDVIDQAKVDKKRNKCKTPDAVPGLIRKK